MLRKVLLALVAVALVGAVTAVPARAQTQTVNFHIGYFSLRGLNSRPLDDVLSTELAGTQTIAGYSDALAFSISDFNHVTFGGEWLFGLGDFLEGGVGVSYYARTVPSIYANLVNVADNSDIPQDLALRIIPVTATVRFLPMGRHSVVEPYIGGGIGVFIWRYSETGQFVDASGNIFTANPPYVGTGTAIGPVIVGGVRAPLGAFVIGGEIRYQRAIGSGLAANNFIADKVDLTGLTYQVTFGLRF